LLSSVDCFGQGRLEQFDADSPVSLDGDHGNGQSLGKLFDVDRDAVALGHVEHVHCHHGRQAELHHLADQVQIPLEIGGVDNTNHRIDRWAVLVASQQEVDGHHLVARSWRQTV